MLGIAITTLTLLHSYVFAQAPACHPEFSWTYNSWNQTPCTMAVALGGACTTGSFTLAPLSPNQLYLGPSKDNANPCQCSTVFYSLLSACALCQNATYLDWKIYDANCSTVYNKIFPEPLPSSTRIPNWAYIDIASLGTFNTSVGRSAVGPESTAVPQATGSSTTTTASSTSAANSNVGAIVGGAVGGLALIGGIAGLAAFFILRRRRKRAGPSGSDHSTYNSIAPETVMAYGNVKYNPTIAPSMTSGKIYDPNDPTTFPTNDPFSHSTYSASPEFNQRPSIAPSSSGNATFVSTNVARTQYTGAPEL